MIKRALTLLALAAALPLAACGGFAPMYGAPGVTKSLTSIEVIAPEGRTGYLLRQSLDDALAKNHGASPVYRMNLSVGEARYPRGVRIDAVATRYEYVLTANYTLTTVATGQPAKTGRVSVTLTYDSADQPYASIAAQQDAQERAADEAARKIQLEVAAWLAASPKT